MQDGPFSSTHGSYSPNRSQLRRARKYCFQHKLFKRNFGLSETHRKPPAFLYHAKHVVFLHYLFAELFFSCSYFFFFFSRVCSWENDRKVAATLRAQIKSMFCWKADMRPAAADTYLTRPWISTEGCRGKLHSSPLLIFWFFSAPVTIYFLKTN